MLQRIDAIRRPCRLTAALGDRPLPVADARELLDVAAAHRQLLGIGVEAMGELGEHVHRRRVAVDLDELLPIICIVRGSARRGMNDPHVAIEPLAGAPPNGLQIGREAGAHDLHLTLIDAVRVAHHDVVDLVTVGERADRVVGHQEPILA